MPNTSGRTILNSVLFHDYHDHIVEVGKTGNVGPQGLPGTPGAMGPEGRGLSGVNYVRWGRTNCSGDATVVYNGKCRSKWNTISQMPFGRVSELFSVIAIDGWWTQSALSSHVSL